MLTTGEKGLTTKLTTGLPPNRQKLFTDIERYKNGTPQKARKYRPFEGYRGLKKGNQNRPNPEKSIIDV